MTTSTTPARVGASTAASAAAAAAAAGVTPRPTTPLAGARPQRRRNLRWLRLIVPSLIAMLLLLVGTGVYQAEQPDLDDAAYLSPDSRAGIGAATLADRVRAAGVRIERFTKSSDALVAAHNGNATLLLTTPELMHPYYLRMLKLLPSTTRVVVVEPDRKTVFNGLMPFTGTRRALASRVAAPRCPFEPAAKAGAAGVLRTRYGPVDSSVGREVARCYGDGLVVYERSAVQVVVVGSADPFRNDRIGEHGNAALATGLLTGAPKLVWLDLHRRESSPLINNDPGLAGASAAPPSLRPGGSGASGDPGDPDFPVRNRGGSDNNAGSGSGGQVENDDGDEPPNPLWLAFPPWTYVATALVVLAVVLLALALARRLGAPVVEPLPVVVRATETVTGRGRLYQRARARGESLQVLRDAAIAKLIRLLRLEPDVRRETLVEAVATRTGWSAPAAGLALFGPAPVDDAGLVEAATHLERLVAAVAAEHGATAETGWRRTTTVTAEQHPTAAETGWRQTTTVTAEQPVPAETGWRQTTTVTAEHSATAETGWQRSTDADADATTDHPVAQDAQDAAAAPSEGEPR